MASASSGPDISFLIDALSDGDVEVRRLARRDAQLPFDLARGPLLRASLVRFRKVAAVKAAHVSAK